MIFWEKLLKKSGACNGDRIKINITRQMAFQIHNTHDAFQKIICLLREIRKKCFHTKWVLKMQDGYMK